MIKGNKPKSAHLKANPNSFIPFQNQRSSTGKLIVHTQSEKKKDFVLNDFLNNLKKSPKQCYFDRELKKRREKFVLAKRYYESHETVNFDKELDQCLFLVDQIQNRKQRSLLNQNSLYITLTDKFNSQIHSLKSQLTKQNTKQTKHNYPKFLLKTSPKTINIPLFKEVGKKSEMMANFCMNGMKYSEFIEETKQNRKQKWYQMREFEVYPGKKITGKILQKSIY